MVMAMAVAMAGCAGNNTPTHSPEVMHMSMRTWTVEIGLFMAFHIEAPTEGMALAEAVARYPFVDTNQKIVITEER
jgi:hypothetical protein